MSNLEFTTRFTPVNCDSCGRLTKAGFHHLHLGTPVLFDCVPCAERHVGTKATEAALEAHKTVSFLRMEAASEAARGGQW
jgi:hypothetical protein